VGSVKRQGAGQRQDHGAGPGDVGDLPGGGQAEADRAEHGVGSAEDDRGAGTSPSARAAAGRSGRAVVDGAISGGPGGTASAIQAPAARS
jgi:hypothetical protein